MSFLKDKIVNYYVESLADDGKNIIKNAALTNTTTVRSGNMKDAYGYAVYFERKIKKKGYVTDSPISSGVHHGWSKRGIPADTGRGYLEKFFSSYVPKNDGFVLICVNVIYYTPILEEGAQGRPHVELSKKYKIISQVNMQFDGLKNKYKGSFVTNV